MDKKIFTRYNFDKISSYDAMFNGIVGARGVGKSFGKKVDAVNKFLKKGEQFIYLRRHDKELKTAKKMFFADFAYKFPRFDMRVVGDEAQIASKKTRELGKDRIWDVMGYFKALSVAQSEKSSPYPLVTQIIFDEFILEPGLIHYIPDEVTVLTNFYNSIDRYEDRVKLWMLANSVSIANPYFIAWGIYPDKEGEFVTRDNGFICFHFPDSSQYQSEVMKSRFGQFIANTEYAKYAVGNQFADNHDNLVGAKHPDSKYKFTIQSKTGSISIWRYAADNVYFVQRKLPKNQYIIVSEPSLMKEGVILLDYKDKNLSYLRAAYKGARVIFDHQTTREIFLNEFYRR